jgi:hypothetical protein
MNKMKFYKVNTVFAVCLFAVCISYLFFFIIHNANWLLGDQLQFLRTTALNKVLPIRNYVIPTLGRFFPLGLMDYNLLLLFPMGYTATAHFILNAVSFLIFVIAFFFLLYEMLTTERNITLNIWIIVFTMLFLIQRVYSVFLDIIFPERIVVMLLAIFMLFTWQFNKTDKWGFGIVALACAGYMVYCKEPLFGALLVFSLTNIVFNWKNLSRNKIIFQWLLIVNSLLFIILYYFLVYRGIETAYSVNHDNTRLGVILSMIRGQKIVIVAFVFLFIRFYSILKKKDYEHLFVDGLLFAGLAYFVACFILQLNTTYYYLPGVVLFTPAIVFWLIHYIKPLGACLVMFLFASFYLVKFPVMIRDNQHRRINTYTQIEKIANYVPVGYKLVWYEFNPEDKSWNSVLRDWKKSALKAYIAYILKDEQFDFITKDSLSENSNSKFIILYPIENDLINKKSTIQFALENKQFSKDTIVQIADVTVMKLSK